MLGPETGTEITRTSSCNRNLPEACKSRYRSMLVGDYERELKRLRESADTNYERIRNLTRWTPDTDHDSPPVAFSTGQSVSSEMRSVVGALGFLWDRGQVGAEAGPRLPRVLLEHRQDDVSLRPGRRGSTRPSGRHPRQLWNEPLGRSLKHNSLTDHGAWGLQCSTSSPLRLVVRIERRHWFVQESFLNLWLSVSGCLLPQSD